MNDQSRLCFRCTESDPEDVEIVDYHRRRTSMVKNGMRPVHPGEILREEYLGTLAAINPDDPALARSGARR